MDSPDSPDMLVKLTVYCSGTSVPSDNGAAAHTGQPGRRRYGPPARSGIEKP